MRLQRYVLGRVVRHVKQFWIFLPISYNDVGSIQLTMTKHMQQSFIDTIEQAVDDGLARGLLHQFTDDAFLNGRSIFLQSRERMNFGSCSYLGLEQHPALIEGVIQAVQNFGTQFSSSRTYLSLGLYKELESLLQAMFDQPAIVSASTTLGHLSALPVLIRQGDAVILDHQVHASVQSSAQLLRAQGIPIHVIRHNNMAALEEQIQQLKANHRHIWYLADGVYSMYGDMAPLNELVALLDTYDQFHLYIDDAHGMSWTGARGVGYVRSRMVQHPKMVLAVSLNKAFAAAGGALIFPNEEMAHKVRKCGGTFIFSGPIQPPMLGAAIASARLHVSGVIEHYQQELSDLVNHTNRRIAEWGLPQFQVTDAPLFFIPIGKPNVTWNVVQRIFEDGFYTNTASFPATPMQKGGMRFTVNRNLTTEDIDQLLERLAYHYPAALIEEGSSYREVARAFKIPEFEVESPISVTNSSYVLDLSVPVELSGHTEGSAQVDTQHQTLQSSGLTVECTRTIVDVDATEWDRLFARCGNFTHASIRMLEQIFTQSDVPENQWDFYYIIVRDTDQKVVLATFYTCALVKDDLFAHAAISHQIEQQRREDPYYLTSRTVMLGCPISQGEHLYLDRSCEHWRDALGLLMSHIQHTVDENDANMIMLREFRGDEDDDMKQTMLDLGLITHYLPDTCMISDLSWQDHDDYLQRLGSKYRYNVRKEILAHQSKFKVITEAAMSADEVRHCYQLYCNVHAKAYDLNVYRLPFRFFEALCAHPDYDVIRLYLVDDPRPSAEQQPVAVMFSCINADAYNAIIVGLDYAYLDTHKIYKQILYQTVQRAWQLKCNTLDLAYTAVLEKKKVGATPRPTRAYVQSRDHYNHAVIESMTIQA